VLSGVTTQPTRSLCKANALDSPLVQALPSRAEVYEEIFAATLMSHGVSELVTCDPRGYALFDGLEVIDPRLPLR